MDHSVCYKMSSLPRETQLWPKSSMLQGLQFHNSRESAQQQATQMPCCRYRDREATSCSTTPSIEESTLAHCSTAGACFRVMTLTSPSKCSVSWSALATSAAHVTDITVVICAKKKWCSIVYKHADMQLLSETMCTSTSVIKASTEYSHNAIVSFQ